MMYRKTFESLYEGSMVGAGSHVFAVWNYAITKQVFDRAAGQMVVRLNPALLAAIIGDTERRMQEAIDFLCAPDPRTSTPGHDGRRLIQLGTFDYQMVNGAKYQALRSEEDRRTQNRDAQRRFRGKHGGKKLNRSDKPLPGEQAYVKAMEEGDERGAEAILESHLGFPAKFHPNTPAEVAPEVTLGTSEGVCASGGCGDMG
jgi:hypothetical protein